MEKIKQLASLDRLQEYISYTIREGYDGSIVIEFIPKYHNCNLYGCCHGGILMTLCDNCMYAAYCYSLELNGITCLPIPQDRTVYTKNMSYSFRRTGEADRPITFIGKVGKDCTTCEVLQDNKVIGYASGEYSILRTSKL